MKLFEITSSGYFVNVQDQIYHSSELAAWQTAPGEHLTKVKKQGDSYWLYCIDYGAINIDCASLTISTYPKKDMALDQFDFFLSREWLPMAYQVCGTQVLHASAVVHLKSDKIIAFCGDTGTGKSTMAYGFAKREGWEQIADDRLAFEVENGKIKPVFIPNHIQLRPGSAKFFGQSPYSYALCSWFDTDLSIDSVFFLYPFHDPIPATNESFKIENISKANAYTLFLKQAFALTTKLSQQNKILMRKYLVLSKQTQSYRLLFTKGFEKLDKIYYAIEGKVC